MKNGFVSDKNMIIQTSIREKEVSFYSADSEYVSLHGVWYENGMYRRMPEAVAGKVSEGIVYGHALPAGGRVRFLTDSSFVAVSVDYDSVELSPRFPVACTSGIDVYEKIGDVHTHAGSFSPTVELKSEDHFESDMKLYGEGVREVTLVLPLYSGIKTLYVGVARDAVLKPAPAYTYEKPVVFYGSSITHGACASRPGNTYLCMISRKMDCDYVSLGFGGNAMGEPAMAEYIAGLSMSAFVLDYDYNAPDAEHLQKTHEQMYRIVREKNPDLPIILVSRPKALDQEEILRFQVIKGTYDKAVAEGDRNVYLIPGYELIPEEWMESAKVDRVHPNDLGFHFMAERIGKELENVLA